MRVHACTKVAPSRLGLVLSRVIGLLLAAHPALSRTINSSRARSFGVRQCIAAMLPTKNMNNLSHMSHLAEQRPAARGGRQQEQPAKILGAPEALARHRQVRIERRRLRQ